MYTNLSAIYTSFGIYTSDERGALRAFVESNRVPSMGRATGQQVIIILASVLINYKLGRALIDYCTEKQSIRWPAG